MATERKERPMDRASRLLKDLEDFDQSQMEQFWTHVREGAGKGDESAAMALYRGHVGLTADGRDEFTKLVESGSALPDDAVRRVALRFLDLEKNHKTLADYVRSESPTH